MKFFAAIRDLFGTASNFAGDPYGHLTNQAAHALAGACVAGILSIWISPLGFWSLAVAAVYFVAFERIAQRGKDIRDSLADSAFIGIGALYVGPWWWPFVIFAATIPGVLKRL